MKGAGSSSSKSAKQGPRFGNQAKSRQNKAIEDINCCIPLAWVYLLWLDEFVVKR